MNNLMNCMKRVLVAAAFVAASGAAQATVISSSSNNPLNFGWSFDTGTSLLTGSGGITLSGFNSNLLTVNVSLTNTSLVGGQGGERLTAFGFGIDPNAAGVSFVDSADAGMVSASMSFIPSLASIEVCAYGGSNCQGGSNGGIFAGASDSFSLVLAGIWGSSVNIDPIGFKYQTGNGSFEFTTASSSSGTVPEPSSGALALLAVGLLGVALRSSRGIRNRGDQTSLQPSC